MAKMALFLSLLIPLTLSAQSISESIQRTAQFQDITQAGNRLQVYNIHGNVIIEGYDGSEIRIEAVKEIGADRQQDLDRAREELQLVVEEEGDRILVYIDAPFIQVRRRTDGISYSINDWGDDYDFLFDITIQVPRNADLHASTINRGKVIVENMSGDELSASNVNGEIELTNVTGTTQAHTVNGDITASYSENPTKNSTYETVNGSIEVQYPEDLSADIRFRSMHGDFYTDFQNLQRLQAQVETKKNSRHGKTTYRIDKFAPLRIGDGGPEFSFEVLNGDVYVKQIKS